MDETCFKILSLGDKQNFTTNPLLWLSQSAYTSDTPVDGWILSPCDQVNEKFETIIKWKWGLFVEHTSVNIVNNVVMA